MLLWVGEVLCGSLGLVVFCWCLILFLELVMCSVVRVSVSYGFSKFILQFEMVFHFLMVYCRFLWFIVSYT